MQRKLTDELIKSVTPKIYRHLMNIGANPEDARDIVQDALYKAVLYIDSISPENIPAWLFKVSINGYYDFCRKRNQKIEISIDVSSLQDEETPETILMTEERKTHINQTLDSLSSIQKHLLVLKYDQKLSYEEISKLLGIPVSTVSTYLFRARQRFAEVYKEVIE